MECPDCEGHGHYHPSVAMERGGDGTCQTCGGSGRLGEEPAPPPPVEEEPVVDDVPPIDDDTQ